METILAVLRPKALPTLSNEFHPRNFDILLTEVKLISSNVSLERGRITKQLPKVLISYEQEPTEALLNYLYKVTGQEKGGLRGGYIHPSNYKSVVYYILLNCIINCLMGMVMDW